MPVNVKQAKKNIARSFDRAARTYNANADLQAEVGTTLLSLCKKHVSVVDQLLDIGAGTGLLTPFIQAAYPAARCYFTDIAENMLAQGRQINHVNRLICADFDRLPFQAKTFDFGFSSMSLQWSFDLLHSLTEILRTLKPKGCLALSLLTEETLPELKQSFSATLKNSPVNTFCQQDQLAHLVSQLPVSVLTLTTQVIRKKFNSVPELLYFLKRTGANYSVNQARSLLTQQDWQQVSRYYQAHFSEGNTLFATFTVTYLLLTKTTG